ncbi:uncharacterized protein LOC131851954 [Achroia grisella]|uniref:uncharacterized protein LOC131851954 n=1 Tax=Achroia grisella TaxID=688607 RepID=UPI0027D23FBC|nr:uncharacterized protein LOC131851954 [Achroia grisella]
MSKDENKMERAFREAAWHPVETLPVFNGTDKTITAARWAQEIEENAEIFGWSATQQLILARRSLAGNALLWLKSEKPFKTYDDLKCAIMKEFPDSINLKELHEILSNRKKGKNESCYEYMLIMKELGKRGKLPDYCVIQYITDGIIDDEINKVMLYGVTTYASLKEKLMIYESMKKKMYVTTRERKPIVTKEHYRDSRKCYKCGENGHIATTCSKGVKCYKCHSYGHISSNCRAAFVERNSNTIGNDNKCISITSPTTGAEDRPERRSMCVNGVNIDANIENGDVRSGSNVDSGDRCHSLGNCQFETVMNTKRNSSIKTLEINGVIIECLIDSGSDVNLVSADVFFELNVSAYNKEKIVLHGLGLSTVYSIGKFQTVLKIDDCYFELLFYIVPTNAMPYKVILGQPFLENAVVIFDKGVVNVVSRNVHCLFTDDKPVSYVPNPQIMETAQLIVDQYKPLQTKEAPFEMQIILNDDVPVAQRPRRLAYKEQEAVDKQIESL